MHAVAAGVLDAPINDLDKISNSTGYPTNGLLFVAESVVRTERISSADDVSKTIIWRAKKRFGATSRKTLTAWKILERTDIGNIYCELVQAKLLPDKGIGREDFNRPFVLGDILDAIAEEES